MEKGKDGNKQFFESFPWIDKDLAAGLSITEIEMQYGVLRSKHDIHAYFYFRSPDMKTLEEHKEKPGSIESQKLERLKNEIRQQEKYPVKYYSKVEDLGNRVEEDFKALVDRLFPQGELSQVEKERLQHKAFLKSRTSFYISDIENNNRINSFVASDNPALVITGESGLGKSALIANWIAANEKSLDSKLIYHFIGNTSQEGDYRKITQRLINEIKDKYGLDEKKNEIIESSSNSDKQKEEFEKLLGKIVDKNKLLIVLDGINQLLEQENAKLLNWLPIFPKNVKLIFSTLLHDATMDVFWRKEYKQLVLQPLTLEKREELIIGYLKEYGKKLLPEQVKNIAKNKKCENTLVLRTLLDELRVFGRDNELLDEQINDFLKTKDITDFFDRVLKRFENTYNNDKYPSLVQELLSLISVSRDGLSEDELLNITEIPPLYWSQFYHAFYNHFVTKNGLISFGHQFLKNAVGKRYLYDAVTEKEYRCKIISFFEMKSEKTNRLYDELPHQFYQLKYFDKLYEFLLDFDVFEYIFGKNKFELGLYWRKLIEEDKEKYRLGKYLKFNILEAKLERLSSLIYDRRSSRSQVNYQKKQEDSFYKQSLKFEQ